VAEPEKNVIELDTGWSRQADDNIRSLAASSGTNTHKLK
jgi:hypothetical protein